MKRVLSLILAAVLVACLFSGCTLNISNVIGADGKVSIKETIKVTEVEMSILKTMLAESEGTEDAINKKLKDELDSMTAEEINGIKYFVKNVEAEFSTMKEFNGYLLTSSEENMPLFDIGEATVSDVWGKVGILTKSTLGLFASTSTVMPGLSEPEVTYSFKFSSPIAKTNGTKKDDNTVEYNYANLKTLKRIYITTEASTADWTKQDDVDAAVAKMIFVAGKPSVFYTKSPSNTSATIKALEKYDDADGYNAYIKLGNGKWKKAGTTNKLSYTYKNLKPSKTYKFRFSAYTKKWGKECESLFSNTEKVTTLNASAKPSLKLTAKKKSFTAKIGKVTGAEGYELKYSVKSAKSGFKTKDSNGRTVTVKKLKSGSKYFVKVRAYRYLKPFGAKKTYGKYSAVKTVIVK